MIGDLTVLPRFVQVRAYDKGMAVARVIRDPFMRFGAPTLEGTRCSPFDLAGELEAGSSDVRIAEDFDITIEQVRVARDWFAAHPECPNKRHLSQSRRRCPDCDDHGYVYSAEELAEIRRVDAECAAYWAAVRGESA